MTNKMKMIVNIILKIFPFIFIQIVVLASLVFKDWNLVKYSAFFLAVTSIFLSIVGLFLKGHKDDWVYTLSSFSIYFTLWLFYYPDNYNLISYSIGELHLLVNIFQVINLTSLLFFFLKKVDIKRIYQIVYIYYFITNLHYALWLRRIGEGITSWNAAVTIVFLISLIAIIFILIIAKANRIISRILFLIVFIVLNCLFINYDRLMYFNELPDIFIEYFKEYFIGLGFIFYAMLILIIEFLDKKRSKEKV